MITDAMTATKNSSATPDVIIIKMSSTADTLECDESTLIRQLNCAHAWVYSPIIAGVKGLLPNYKLGLIKLSRALRKCSDAKNLGGF